MSITPLTPINPPQAPVFTDESAPAPGSGGEAFSQVLQNLLASTAQSSQNANHMVQSLISGQAENLHTVTLAVAQADLSFRLMLELRNRATDAYQEIMRMQI